MSTAAQDDRTAECIAAAARRLAETSRLRQGLGPLVDSPSVYERLAELVRKRS